MTGDNNYWGKTYHHENESVNDKNFIYFHFFVSLIKFIHIYLHSIYFICFTINLSALLLLSVSDE